MTSAQKGKGFSLKKPCSKEGCMDLDMVWFKNNPICWLGVRGSPDVIKEWSPTDCGLTRDANEPASEPVNQNYHRRKHGHKQGYMTPNQDVLSGCLSLIFNATSQNMNYANYRAVGKEMEGIMKHFILCIFSFIYFTFQTHQFIRKSSFWITV